MTDHFTELKQNMAKQHADLGNRSNSNIMWGY
jgi:hypothetical protein